MASDSRCLPHQQCFTTLPVGYHSISGMRFSSKLLVSSSVSCLLDRFRKPSKESLQEASLLDAFTTSPGFSASVEGLFRHIHNSSSFLTLVPVTLSTNAKRPTRQGTVKSPLVLCRIENKTGHQH